MEQPVPDDKWLAEKFRQIDAEIAELKAARPMVATTQHGGAFILQDVDGTQVWRFGAFSDGDGNAAFGVGAYDEDGATVLGYSDTARGLLYPHEYHQWVVPTSQAISSGSFVGVAECEIVLANADTICAGGAITVPAGSTGEGRIRESHSGATTDVVPLTDGKSGTLVFEWIHPFTVGWGDPTPGAEHSPFLHWEVRLASGAGPLTVFPPRYLTLRNHAFTPAATETGGGRF